MSSDQTQPVPEWWQQAQDAKRNQAQRRDQVNQENQADQGSQGTQDFSAGQGYQDSQATRQFPSGQGFPPGTGFPSGQEAASGQGFPPGQGSPSGQGFSSNPTPASGSAFPSSPTPASGSAFPSSPTPASGSAFPSSPTPASGSGFPSGQAFQSNQVYQQDQDYPGRGYQGTPGYPPGQGFPAGQGYQGSQPRMRRRRRRWPFVTLIVIILVLLGADRAANAYTEDQMASQMQASLALSGKPHVTIQGFPFLTQLAARDFRTVDINASNETAGPGGQLEIASLTATLHGMHIHGLKSATVDQFNASALITFAALANVSGAPEGVTFSADGPNRIKASIDIGPLSESASAQVTQTGPGQINIKVLDVGGITSDVLGNLNFNVDIPKLPAGVSIKSISITQQGVRISVSGQNTTLSQ
jgi:hypothetical protein